MTYVKLNVPKPTKAAPGAPESRDPDIVIVETTDIVSSPVRDSKGVKMVGTYVFKAGTYAIKIYGTPSTIIPTKSSDGDEDAIAITQGLEFAHPGDELEINEFIQNFTGKSIIAFVKTGACEGGNAYYKVYGSKCTPLTLKFEVQNDNEATKNTIRLEAFKKSNNVPGFYYGNLTFDSVLATVAADETTVDVTNGNGEYQLTTGSSSAAAITDLDNGSNGDVITLLGSGGAYPSTIAASEAKFEMVDGADWTANAGATITFKGFKNGPEADDILWIEQART